MALDTKIFSCNIFFTDQYIKIGENTILLVNKICTVPRSTLEGGEGGFVKNLLFSMFAPLSDFLVFKNPEVSKNRAYKSFIAAA